MLWGWGEREGGKEREIQREREAGRERDKNNLQFASVDDEMGAAKHDVG